MRRFLRESVAIGDIYNTPPVRKNRNIVLPGAAGFDWKTSIDWTVEVPLEFNKNEWELIAIAGIITAQQTFISPIPLTGIRLDMAYSIRNYTNDGSYIDSGIGTNSIEWVGAVEAGRQKQVDFGIDIQGSATARTALFINSVYKLPIFSLTEQKCNTTVDMAFSFRSKVANPTTTPFAKPPIEGGTVMNLNLWWLVTVGAIAIVGLLAVGFAAEKTGVNVGVVGNVWTGTTNAVGGFVHGVRSMIKV